MARARKNFMDKASEIRPQPKKPTRLVVGGDEVTKSLFAILPAPEKDDSTPFITP